MTRVLVAHASKYGSVEEVARYVGAVLRDEGAGCDVVAARAAGIAFEELCVRILELAHVG